MQLKDLLKPHQLELLQKLRSMPTATLEVQGKTVNKVHGKTPIPKVQPKPLQPTVTIKKQRHVDKGTPHE
jgi:hypothetical protein